MLECQPRSSHRKESKSKIDEVEEHSHYRQSAVKYTAFICPTSEVSSMTSMGTEMFVIMLGIANLRLSKFIKSYF